jgi:hypothetical protein
MNSRSISNCQPVLRCRAGKGCTIMAGNATRAGSRSGKARKALIIAVALAFLALAGDSPGVSGQSASQVLGTALQGPRQLPGQNRFPTESQTGFPKSSQKRKKALLDYNFKKLKQHAQDLAELAKSLQAEVDKSNENVLSLEIVKKADQAEKLARKIKNEAKGY